MDNSKGKRHDVATNYIDLMTWLISVGVQDIFELNTILKRAMVETANLLEITFDEVNRLIGVNRSEYS